MYKLRVRSEFSAAHNLRGYRGKCEALHGHNWKVEAALAARDVGRDGLAMDFHVIKRALKKILDELDHAYLNELPYFKKQNPTSENLARYIYEKLRIKFVAADCELREVTVWESDNCSATYDAR
jgi:6-pyruvoyltetrahydropterin/6-carboxytetrahydropterin synthase